ncbi:MAG: DnaD domain protein [Firmicutes bacterium]|nr:DnaD domain protein [Bacillota bacterium]
MPGFKTKTEYILLPKDFVSDYMSEANGAYVKVYLYALMLASENRSEEQLEVAKALNLLESDVKNAFDYWKDKGLLEYDGADIVMKTASAGTSDGKKSAGQIAKIMLENSDLSGLCNQIIPSLLKKPITPKDMQTVYWMYDELGFTPEMIAVLIEYCASNGKDSVQYAEKVAVTWSEKGLNTIEKMERYIENEKKRKSYFYSIRKLMGISDRPLHQKEEEYLRKWSADLNMNEDMVALAYEYCIMQTSKLSFPYMDSILENWDKKNIHDVESAEAEHTNFQGKRSEKGFDVYADNIDHGSLEELTQKHS